MPWAECGTEGSEPPGAWGKVRMMEVFSSAPVGAYLETEETTVGAERRWGGTVW